MFIILILIIIYLFRIASGLASLRRVRFSDQALLTHYSVKLFVTVWHVSTVTLIIMRYIDKNKDWAGSSCHIFFGIIPISNKTICTL